MSEADYRLDMNMLVKLCPKYYLAYQFSQRKMPKISYHKTFKRIFLSLIHSHLNAGISLYSGTFNSNLTKSSRKDHVESKIERISIDCPFSQPQTIIFLLFIRFPQ